MSVELSFQTPCQTPCQISPWPLYSEEYISVSVIWPVRSVGQKLTLLFCGIQSMGHGVEFKCHAYVNVAFDVHDKLLFSVLGMHRK